MSKEIKITSPEEVESYILKLSASANATTQTLTTKMKGLDPLEFLAKIKFCQIGCDPLDTDRELNMIEQLDQTFTYLASFMAVEYLYTVHPEIPCYRLNLGTSGGHDIESCPDNTQIICKVFAAVRPTNNNKLRKDAERLTTKSSKHKYVFFMCPGYDRGMQSSDVSYPDVKVYSLGLPVAW